MASSTGDGTVGGDRKRGRDAGGVERAAFERALRRLGANRRLRHGVIGDPRAGDPAAGERQLGGDRKHRDAFGMDAGDFREAERRAPPAA